MSVCVYLSILIICCFFSKHALSGKGDSTQIMYISYISNITLNKITGEGVEYKQLMKTDDSPLATLTLPWDFIFLGETVDKLFLSPNGAVMQSYVQPCPPLNVFATNDCDLSNSYNFLIAGLLADLDPVSSPYGSIWSYVGAGYITVMFSNIRYYGSRYWNSFRITFFKDSHIEVSYDLIFKNAAYPPRNLWISGLRASNSSYVYFSEDQIKFGRKEWNTSIYGAYPSPSDVKTGNQFNMCPFSLSWCLTPSTISADNVNDNIAMSTLLLSCVEKLEFGLIIMLDSSDIDEQFNVPCTALNDSSITCSILNIVSNNYSTNYDTNLVLAVWPAYKLRDSAGVVGSSSSSNYTAMSVSNTSLNLIYTAANSNLSCTNNIDIINSFSSASPHTCPANGCSPVCNRNITCLNLPCSNTVLYEYSSYDDDDRNDDIYVKSNSVYARLSCNGTCSINSTTASSSENARRSNYYTDPTGQCCTLSDMDCSGVCGGNAVVALDAAGSIYCCPPTSAVDCAGVCGGTAIRDNCNICNGRDTTGVSCFNSAGIIVDTGYADGALYPTIDLAEGNSNNYSQTVILNVTNTTPAVVTVSFSESSITLEYAPILHYTNTVALIPVNTTIQFAVNVSLSELYLGSVSKWVVKTLTMTYARVAYTAKKYRTAINIYPATINCASIPKCELVKCASMPACIFCFAAPTMRILSSSPLLRQQQYNNNNNVNNSLLSQLTSYELYRKLRETIGDQRHNANKANDNYLQYLAGNAYIGSFDKLLAINSTHIENNLSVTIEQNRVLFANLLPDQFVNNDDEGLYNGVCSDGWLTTDCSNSANSYYSSSSGEITIRTINSSIVRNNFITVILACIVAIATPMYFL